MKFYFLFTILTSITLYVTGQTQPIVASTARANCFHTSTINTLVLPEVALNVNLAYIKPTTETVASPDIFTLRKGDSLNPPLNLTISSIVNEGIIAIQLHWQLPDTAYHAAKASGSSATARILSPLPRESFRVVL